MTLILFSLISVIFYMKYNPVKSITTINKGVWIGGWAAILFMLLSVIGVFGSYPKLILHPEMWGIDMLINIITPPILAFVIFYGMTKLNSSRKAPQLTKEKNIDDKKIIHHEVTNTNLATKRITITCPKCGEKSRVPKNIQIQVECPHCSQTWVGTF